MVMLLGGFFFFLIINFLNKFLLQLFYQNFIFLMLMIFLFNFPLNNMNFWIKIYYMIGMDYYSFSLVMLSIWILSLMIMVSGKMFTSLSSKFYLMILNFLLMFLLLCFLSMNLMMFYLFFECSLLPIFLLIMGWGYQVDRIQAGFYMMLYTLFGSLPLFVMILMIYKNMNSLMINFIEIKNIGFILYLMMIMAFLIKMPMYFVHLWLPKAHVEAPLMGSMILAGVMLKLGSYGLFRFMFMMMKVCLKFNKFFIILSLLGGVYSSLICLYQIDMKMLVAYSSVVHMSMLMAGMMTLMSWGISGGLIMMIAHGLCSSGMFCLVNINYERLKTRSLMINKGLINFFPSLTFFWFLLCSSNLSFPPSLNLFGEILLINSMVLWSMNLIYILLFLMFFSACYSLYLYSYSQHGSVSKMITNIQNINVLDYMILLLHWIPLNLMFILIFLYL